MAGWFGSQGYETGIFVKDVYTWPGNLCKFSSRIYTWPGTKSVKHFHFKL